MNISTTFFALLFLFGAFNSINANTPTSIDATPSFYMNTGDICVNETFDVPVSVTDFEMITSFQFTIGWDNSLMNFDTVSYISPALGSTLLYNDMSSDEGVLTISWYDLNVVGLTVDDLTELFHIQFTAIADNQTEIQMTFEDSPTMKEVSGYVGNDIMVVEAVYVEGSVNVDVQELDTYEVINDVNDSNSGGVNITVKNGATPYSYIWSNDAETQNLENVGAGDYMVTVTDAKGCETVFGEFTVDNTVGTNELTTLQSINLFPNPAGDLTHITAAFDNVEDLEVSVFNILGERVILELHETANLDIDLDVSGLNNGTYILQLKSKNGAHTEKLEILR